MLHLYRFQDRNHYINILYTSSLCLSVHIITIIIYIYIMYDIIIILHTYTHYNTV